MARADLFDTSPDQVQPWMEAVSDVLDGTVLFVTHPTDAGSADAGPIVRLSPTQVIAYQFYNTARHTDADAQEGDAGSAILVRAVSIDPDGEPSILTTLSGSPGTSQLDTNMRHLVDAVVAGEAGLSVAYDGGAGTTTTDNALPGILEVPIVLDSFGTAADVVAVAHNHQDNDGGGTLGRNALTTLTDVSFAGSIAANTRVDIPLEPRAFFPMFHITGNAGISHHLIGHATDVSDEDLPRLGLLGDTTLGTTQTYDVDFRYVESS